MEGCLYTEGGREQPQEQQKTCSQLLPLLPPPLILILFPGASPARQWTDLYVDCQRREIIEASVQMSRLQRR